MANIKYMAELNSVLGMDGPITKGPPPRWQKKTMDKSQSGGGGSSNSSQNINKSGCLSSSTVNTSTAKTPSKSPGRTKNKSPGRKNTPTPNKGGKSANADRFIPVRNNSNYELGHFVVRQESNGSAAENDDLTIPPIVSPSHKEAQRIMSEKLHGTDISKKRILAFQNKAPAPPEGFTNPMRVIYTQTKTPASMRNSTRYVPHAPDRILDAPDIVDDYYLNLVDWSAGNVLAVALGAHVYLWNAATGAIEQLLELEAAADYVCSVSWIQEEGASHLAVGTTEGTVQLWDCARVKRLRTMDGHAGRVGALAWNAHVLSSGGRAGYIVHHDVRQRDHKVSSVEAHTQEVCGLRWSPDQRHLASGGNDNVLRVWQAGVGVRHGRSVPLHTWTQHQAAVKAVAWCPWKPHVLASGGGTADRCIRLWNINTGGLMQTVDTKSQVCALLWSQTHGELVSGHGYANYQLIIWKYPLMSKVAELTGHSARVLHLAMSPDATTVLSAGADETLRLWKCFGPDPSKKKDQPTSSSATAASSSMFRHCIR